IPSLLLFFYTYRDHRALHSFPTRRSSDLHRGHCRDRRFDRRPERLRDHALRLQPRAVEHQWFLSIGERRYDCGISDRGAPSRQRSEEHTSELQSRENLVCRLLLEKKKNKK